MKARGGTTPYRAASSSFEGRFEMTTLTDVAGADADTAQPDLSRLSTDELALFEKLLLKIAGEFTGDVDVPFRIELVRQIVDTTAEPISDAN
jgi:hypothetical protein